MNNEKDEKKMTNFLIGCIGFVCVAIVLCGLSYLFIAGVSYVILVWVFELAWTWQMAFGIWLILALLGIAFKK